jgi:DNA-binding NarL/FixJ family response regulator
MRVLVINSEDLLSAGVESLLSREVDFEIIKKQIPDRSALASALKEFQPDVVITNEKLLFTYPSTMIGLLKVIPGLCVIVLDENENILHVYVKKEVVVKRAMDLIATIRSSERLFC